MKETLLFLAVAAFFAALFTLFPGIDLWASGLVYRAGAGFYLAGWPPVRILYRLVPWLTEAILALVVLAVLVLIARRRPLLGIDWWRALYITLAIAIGPGLVTNTVLKDHWGRARPTQIALFGGKSHFTPALEPAAECPRNCSFPSGHAALCFSLVTFAFLVEERRRRSLAIAGAMAAGTLAGFARIAQGGHFLSDVVFAGLIVTATSWLLYHLILGEAGRRLAGYTLATPGRRLAALAIATAAAVILSMAFLDETAARFFHARDGMLAALFHQITRLGDSAGWLAGSAALWCALRLAARQRLAASRRLRAWSQLPLFFFTAVAVSGLAADLLKMIFGRARPKLLFAKGEYGFTWGATHASLWSFPSGHTTTAFAVATALALIWPGSWPIVLLAALLIAASRVIITAHYPSDVVAAAFLGYAVTLYVRFVFARCGIVLAEARAGRLGPPSALSWRERLGLGRLAGRPRAVSDSL